MIMIFSHVEVQQTRFPILNTEAVIMFDRCLIWLFSNRIYPSKYIYFNSTSRVSRRKTRGQSKSDKISKNKLGKMLNKEKVENACLMMLNFFHKIIFSSFFPKIWVFNYPKFWIAQTYFFPSLIFHFILDKCFEILETTNV